MKIQSDFTLEEICAICTALDMADPTMVEVLSKRGHNVHDLADKVRNVMPDLEFFINDLKKESRLTEDDLTPKGLTDDL